MPLEGVIVLDFTTHKLGPLAKYFLAVMGAMVVKIEELKRSAVRDHASFVGMDGLR